MANRKLLLSLLSLTFLLTNIFAQTIKSMEFRDQDIKDVLFILAKQNKISIVPDETVNGRISYVFTETNFEEAFSLFLSSFDLSYTKQNNVYFISKVHIDYNKDSDRLDLRAHEAPFRAVIHLLSVASGTTILTDDIQDHPVSINLTGGQLSDALEILTIKNPLLSLIKKENYYYIKQKNLTEFSPNQNSNDGGYVKNVGDLFSIELENSYFQEVIRELFKKAGKELALLTSQNPILTKISFSNKTFNEMLTILLSYGNIEYLDTGTMYYIFDRQHYSQLSSYLANILYIPKYLTVSDLQKLLPNLNESNQNLKFDSELGRIAISAPAEEADKILKLLQTFDIQENSNSLYTFDLKYIKAELVSSLLPQEFSSYKITPLSSGTGFMVKLPVSFVDKFRQVLIQIDQPYPIFPYKLKYLQSDQLLASPPPSAVTLGSIVKTGSSDLIYFKGTQDQFRIFESEMQLIDVPKKQLRYEILIVQFSITDGLISNAKYNVIADRSKSSFSVTGAFQSLLGINFDVISGLGHNFAINLETKISTSNAKVLTDTILRALVNEKITLSNTETTRLRDTESDPTSGNTKTIIRELTSGLNIMIDGWVSEDRMITVNIDASLSRQGNASTEAGVPPATSQKRIVSKIRTRSGEPIIIGGLKHDEIVTGVDKIPLLGDIPLIGWLFQQRSDSRSSSEFSIFLVPHLEEEIFDSESVTDKLDQLYYEMKGMGS